MVEQRDPHVVDEALTHPGRVPALDEAEARAGERHCHGRDRQHQDQGLVMVRYRSVQQGTEEQGGDDADDGGGDDADEEPDERGPIRPGHPEHAHQQLALDPLAAHSVRIAPEAHDRLMHHRGDQRTGSAACSFTPVPEPAPAYARSMTATIDPEVRDELRAGVRRWVEREVLPVASDFEHADEYPTEIVEQMKALGLFGITIPEELGDSV